MRFRHPRGTPDPASGAEKRTGGKTGTVLRAESTSTSCSLRTLRYAILCAKLNEGVAALKAGLTPLPLPLPSASFHPDRPRLPEPTTLAETVGQRRDGIENHIRTGMTNAASEGNDRVIKLEGPQGLRLPQPAEATPAITLRDRSTDLRQTDHPSSSVTHVREAVADSVASSGTDTVFALMGATNQELMCDLEERCRMRLVHCRHEAGAVGMADGYARFSGRLGVATVTAGPGVTNTATSLAVARAHRSPVLLLAGDTPVGDVRNPQYFQQNRFTKLCAGEGVRLGHSGELAKVLQSAASVLASDHPFVLNLPVDVQEQPAELPHQVSLREAAAPGDAAETDETEVARAAQLLAAAGHPVVLAGRGALGARDVLADIAQLTGAPLVTTLRAAGLFAGHPLEAGVAGAMGDGRALRLLETADLVLSAGTSLHPLAASALDNRQSPPVLVRIDTAPPRGARVYGADLRADTRTGADRLLRQLAARGPTGPASSGHDRTSGSWASHHEDRRTGTEVHPLDALDEVRGLLPEQRLLVIGGGHASLSACQSLPASAPRDFTCVSTDFGAIGQSLPVAIGACFARPGQRVFNVTADGELMMALAELHTAVRYRLPLTIIVLNDHGFGQERHNLTRAGHATHHATHPTPDLVSFAQSMGASGYRVTRPDELVNLRRAFSHQQGVVLIDIHIDPSYLNPASAYVASAMSRRAQR